ncbi:MAG: flagellar type III secretion system pore protein FliP [Sandaracinaceae bacterium]|jgi:flagellar biosynthetic protein FliP|nr:flagellar type III secretion system pore protein FliP [Sandaracinaceae bacterium]
MTRPAALLAALITFAAALGPALAIAQDARSSDPIAVEDAGEAGPSITIAMPASDDHAGRGQSVRILVLLTVLAIAPAILISVTSFTRIIVVLTFVRQAIGSQGAPPTQVLLALSLLLTGVVMGPVLARVNEDALSPYMEETIDGDEAFERATTHIRDFLLRQTREEDLVLFYDVSHTESPAAIEDVELRLLVPAFMISELRTAFEMGFLVFLPFVLVDLLAGSILSAMGMVMMPPTMISTPLKLLLFVAVDGWALLVQALVASYG